MSVRNAHNTSNNKNHKTVK